MLLLAGRQRDLPAWPVPAMHRDPAAVAALSDVAGREAPDRTDGSSSGKESAMKLSLLGRFIALVALFVANVGLFTPTAANAAMTCAGTNTEFRKVAAPVGGDYFVLVARHSGKCVAIESESLLPGARMVQYACPPPDDPIGGSYWTYY
jgi:hypothetical protein